MMRLLMGALAWLTLAGAAMAQAVNVLSGEHDGFSRLVFDLPERMAYEISLSDREGRITFERSGLQWRTDSVFDLVPRDRLDGIEAGLGEKTVVLSLNCDCEIDTFWHGRAFLVVDIRDPSGKPEKTPSLAKQDLVPLSLEAGSRGRAALLVSAGLDGPRAPEPAPENQETDKDLDGGAISESRGRLIKQIGRAASQGLLSPRTMLGRKPEPAPASRAVRQDPEPEPPAPKRPNIQLRAETSIDRDMGAVLMSGLGMGSTTACLDPAGLNLSDWGTDAPFHAQVGPLRARLLGEFDRPERDTVLELARTYIYFGFGAEARQVLRQLGQGAAPERVLHDMADILEMGHAGMSSSLSGQMDCAPSVALWSALSYPEFPRDASLDADGVLRGFSALPSHLRAHLGPDLARRMAEAGYAADSRRLRRILTRTPEIATPDAALLEAEAALEDGEEAEAALELIVSENSEPSAEALLSLIRHRLKQETEISYETAQLAGAYAHEHRGQPLGKDLQAAYLSALAASGAFDEAFEGLARVTTEEAAQADEIRASLVDLLTRRADDYEFLQYAFSEAKAAGKIDPETANAAAARLLELGFADAAAQFVAPETEGPAGQRRRLLRAEIALSQDRPREAEAALLGLAGAEADLLRAEARSKAGEHDVAKRLFAGIGRAGEARREAWLASDWQALADDEDPARGGIAKLKLADSEAPEVDEDGILARNRALIDQSLETRDAVRALLDANPLPAE